MQKRYIVDGNLNHDDLQLQTGDVVLLEDDQAAPLLAIGRIKEAVEEIAPASQPVPPEPDGFPQRDIPPAQQESAPAPAQPPQQAVPQFDPQQPKQPTPEEIAATAASVQ